MPLRWLVIGLGAQYAGAVVTAPTPTITPAPSLAERQDPNAYVEIFRLYRRGN